MSAAPALRIEDVPANRRDAGLAITLRGLTKSFDEGAPVIRNLNLHVPAGQFVAIVGRSGCGKSTLLRLILGLEEPSAGRVTVNGSQNAKRIMFQEPRLLPWARVADNVAVGLGRDIGRAERKARALAVLGEVGLAEKAGNWPATLSGGQRQRVILARALYRRPEILFLDEATSALDEPTEAVIAAALKELRMTRVIVAHRPATVAHADLRYVFPGPEPASAPRGAAMAE